MRVLGIIIEVLSISFVIYLIVDAELLNRKERKRWKKELKEWQNLTRKKH